MERKGGNHKLGKDEPKDSWILSLSRYSTYPIINTNIIEKNHEIDAYTIKFYRLQFYSDLSESEQ